MIYNVKVQDNQFTAKGFLVWGICILFCLYAFLLHTSIGTFQHSIMQDLNLTSAFEFSLLSSTVFVLMYGVMQIPVGLVVDKIGLKNSLLIGAAACAIAKIGFACSYSYPLAIFFRMLMGFGSAFGFICLVIAVYDWMPHRYAAIFIGISQFFVTLGPMLAGGPLNAIAQTWGVDWRFIFLGLGGVGILATVLIYLFVEGNCGKVGEGVFLHRHENISASIKQLFSKIQPWYIAMLSACVYFSVEYFSANEGRAFLALKGVSLRSASYMITVGWIGHAIGCPLLGFISDFIKRRKIVMILSAFLGLVAILMILYTFDERYLLWGFFLLGLSASGQSVGFALMGEQFAKRFVAIGFGLNNAMITAVAAINAPVIGRLLDHTRAGVTASLDEYISVTIP